MTREVCVLWCPTNTEQHSCAINPIYTIYKYQYFIGPLKIKLKMCGIPKQFTTELQQEENYW